jgi:hypothetical protein
VSIERLGHAVAVSGDVFPGTGGPRLRAVVPVALGGDAELGPEAEEFVRFCYQRRSVSWPELYDEMCAVAARGTYRGMCYEQLEEIGIGFSLGSLPRLARLAQRVVVEERSGLTTMAALSA